MFDEIVGGAEYFLRGTVVFLQFISLDFGKGSVELQDIPYVRPSPAVDTLVVVAHHENVAPFACQKFDQSKLYLVGVLKFVHVNIAEFILIIASYVLVFTQQKFAFYQQVVEVHSVVFFQNFLVSVVNFAYGHGVFFPRPYRIEESVGRKSGVFCFADKVAVSVFILIVFEFLFS